jgi:glycosyltransferase involved in cell wall biosynthesis
MTFGESLLILAPHLQLPARNGADVTLVELAPALSAYFPDVLLVGSSEVVRYAAGSETDRVTYTNRLRQKHVAGVRTLLRGSHYFLERFVTAAFRREAQRHLANPAFKTVLHSYITTAAVAEPAEPERRHLVWTHNDEFKWFGDLARKSRSPVTGAVVSASQRWLRRFLNRNDEHLTLLHVTAQDREGWADHVPTHTGHVVPIGVEIASRPAPELHPDVVAHLLFVGSLGVQMNQDALDYFAARFWPVISERLGPRASVTIAGSRPSLHIRQLAVRLGWSLRPDVSDEELDDLFASATFSLSPFSYATGAKLKLLKSLSYGVPVLATSAVQAQADLVGPPSLLSDEPNEWADHIESVLAQGIDRHTRQRLVAKAEEHSWTASAALIARIANG